MTHAGGFEKSSSLTEALSRFEEKIGRARVIIAEDDFLIAMQTEQALSTAGLEVVGITITAQEVLDLARQERPALVIMDIRLAGRHDGIDAARELFQQLNIRCIFATANDDLHTRERAQRFAPFGWLTKPYTMKSLIDSVADALVELGRDAAPD